MPILDKAHEGPVDASECRKALLGIAGCQAQPPERDAEGKRGDGVTGRASGHAVMYRAVSLFRLQTKARRQNASFIGSTQESCI